MRKKWLSVFSLFHALNINKQEWIFSEIFVFHFNNLKTQIINIKHTASELTGFLFRKIRALHVQKREY